ncbi:MAG: endo-polygalacturonase [Muribaculaceae bacterium]|nr:endo-polygalacturonase [Muribaculaceae bacterium]
MKFRQIIAFSALACGILYADAELVTYPAGQGVPTINDFTINVRQNGGAWQPVVSYPVKVDEVIGAKHSTSVASMAYFDFDGPVDVEVIAHRESVKSARIRPLSYDLKPEVCGDTLRFTLDRPRNLSVEVNGDIFHNLHLFANPLDSHRPSAKEIKLAQKGKNKKLIYFGPGVHRLPGDTLRVASGQTVYVDGGARVYGQLIADGVNDVRFYGRGEIHPEGRGEGIYIKRSKDVDAEGVIVTQIPVGKSDGVNIDNVKSISYYGWGDGMNVFASNNVHYNNVFCRNSDDCSTIYATRKGFSGGCDNILMENSTLWADVAHPIMIGLHGAATEIGVDAPADTISNVTYRNIDILDHKEAQIDYQGCMAIVCGDNNIVRDLVFDNIRVEDFRQGQLFNIRLPFNLKYCKAPGGKVSDVLFKDITYNGNNAEMSIIAGYDDDRTVDNITFDNLVINGVHICDDMPGKPKWYKTGDFARIFIGEHVNNVVFK